MGTESVAGAGLDRRALVKPFGMAACATRLGPLLIVLALVLAGCDTRTLDAAETRARVAWREAGVQHRRRVEILPPLLATVRAHAPQEREVVAEVEAALQMADAAPADDGLLTDPVRWPDFIRSRIRLSNAIQDLLATVERYLDLKRNAAYLPLRSQLLDSLDRAAVARGDYNAAARIYNAELNGWWSGRLARQRHPDAKPLQLFTGLPTTGDSGAARP